MKKSVNIVSGSGLFNQKIELIKVDSVLGSGYEAEVSIYERRERKLTTRNVRGSGMSELQTVKSFKTLSGLGDAVFAAPIVSHFAKESRVYVSTQYPEVFKFINGSVQAEHDTRMAATHLRYTRAAGSNYYEDYCKCAGLPMLPFVLPWHSRGIVRQALNMVSMGDKKLCLIKEPSTAHMDRNRNDFRITPAVEVMQKWLNSHADEFYFITVEHETNTIKQSLTGISARIKNLGTTEYIDLCNAIDHIATQIGHLCPIAQALGKPLTVFKPEKKASSGFMQNVTTDAVLVPREFAPSPVEII